MPIGGEQAAVQVEEPPTVNDLANLLAESMRRPLDGFSHQPRCLYLRARPEWAELLPHLKQIGVEVNSLLSGASHETRKQEGACARLTGQWEPYDSH
jgi:hypothetical protein